MFDLDTHIDVIHHHGSTDKLVAADVLKFHGVDEKEIWDKMPAVRAGSGSGERGAGRGNFLEWSFWWNCIFHSASYT